MNVTSTCYKAPKYLLYNTRFLLVLDTGISNCGYTETGTLCKRVHCVSITALNVDFLTRDILHPLPHTQVCEAHAHYQAC